MTLNDVIKDCNYELGKGEPTVTINRYELIFLISYIEETSRHLNHVQQKIRNMINDLKENQHDI